MRKLLFFIVLMVFCSSGYAQDHVFNKTLRNAENGDAKSQYWVGRYYEDGSYGCQKNCVKALYWLVRCAKQGGYRYLPSDKFDLATDAVVEIWNKNRSSLSENNYTTAFNLIKEGAEANIHDFQEMLGECYFEGVGVSKDYSKAFYWYIKASNNPKSCNHVYNIYWVDNLSITSCYHLGLCYQKGWGTQVDYKKALECFISSVSFNSILEIYNDIDRTNRSLDNDLFNYLKKEVESYILYFETDRLMRKYHSEEAIAQSCIRYVRTMYYLGNAYEMGRGTQRDVEQAQYYYRKLIDVAEKNNVQVAEINLAKQRLGGGVNPSNQLSTITFTSSTTSSTTYYNLRAGIKSSCKITNVSVSVNNARGIDVVVNDGNDFTLNRNLQLNYGSNTITVSVTNCAGTTTKNLVVNVQGNLPPQPSNRRVAIVIGNSNYPKAPLTNPVNDATDMAAILRTLGFDVTLKTDLTHSGFENALKNFKYKADNSDVALLYYAGHGMEIDGTNYLIPTDAPISDLDQLKYKSVNANYALQILSGAKKKIIILDACRNNPAMRDIMHGGLAVMSAPNAFFAYSTSPGKTAEDGTGRNSPYTSALLKALGYKNLTLPQLFQKVGQFVHATNPTQVPWTASSLIEDVIFNR